MYPTTTTDSNGRYTFRDLPAGLMAVIHSGGDGAPVYEQLCAAAVELGPGMSDVDLEITSPNNPQPSPNRRPLVISGQVYEMTSAGRVGLAGANLAVDWSYESWLGPTAYTDADGRYSICGIPSGWALTFVAGKPESGYDYVSRPALFHADATFDMELKRRNQ